MNFDALVFKSNDEVHYTTVPCYKRYLTKHFWEVIDVGGAEALGLEAFGLQQVFSDVGCVDEHAMKRTLLISIRLEHDLKTGEMEGKRKSTIQTEVKTYKNLCISPHPDKQITIG